MDSSKCFNVLSPLNLHKVVSHFITSALKPALVFSS